ncbi:MAG: type II toxin-antitoxin system VapC family toxin [Ignavibacteria bacterium]|nr:type II toxin-antitoxin system VapC family toxin [Ignavibacteria bacterium]
MKHKYKVYLDTSVISALFDSRNPERKIFTERFFKEIDLFEIFVSEIVISEIDNTQEIQLRTKMKKRIENFSILPFTDDIYKIADDFVSYGAIPERYKTDATHLAIAALNDMDFIVSWNFKHIVKRKTKEIARMVNTINNIKQIEIVTPAELLQ